MPSCTHAAVAAAALLVGAQGADSGGVHDIHVAAPIDGCCEKCRGSRRRPRCCRDSGAAAAAAAAGGGGLEVLGHAWRGGGIDAGRGGKGTQWVVSILQCGEGKKRGVAVVERERRCSSHIRRRSEAGGGRKVKQMIIAHPARGRRATNGRVFYSGVKRKGWGSSSRICLTLFVCWLLVHHRHFALRTNRLFFCW